MGDARSWIERARELVSYSLERLEPLSLTEPAEIEKWDLRDRTIIERILARVDGGSIGSPRHCSECREEFVAEMGSTLRMIERYIEGGYTEPQTVYTVYYRRLDGGHGFTMTYREDKGEKVLIQRPPMAKQELSGVTADGFVEVRGYTVNDYSQATVFKEEIYF